MPPLQRLKHFSVRRQTYVIGDKGVIGDMGGLTHQVNLRQKIRVFAG